MPLVKRMYVIPGEVVAQGDHRPLANVLKVGNDLVSIRVGMAEISREGVKVIPLCGPYIPRVEDMVIGKIVDYSAFAWEVDINSCFFAFLPAQDVFGRRFDPSRNDLAEKLGVGDLVAAKIIGADRTRDPVLTISDVGLGKIPNGEIVKISSTKVPRLIGKKGVMIRSIEGETRCRLMIGQNGIVVISGSREGTLKAVEAIRLIEQEAHVADLSQKVQALLVKEGSG